LIIGGYTQVVDWCQKTL